MQSNFFCGCGGATVQLIAGYVYGIWTERIEMQSRLLSSIASVFLNSTHFPFPSDFMSSTKLILYPHYANFFNFFVSSLIPPSGTLF